MRTHEKKSTKERKGGGARGAITGKTDPWNKTLWKDEERRYYRNQSDRRHGEERREGGRYKRERSPKYQNPRIETMKRKSFGGRSERYQETESSSDREEHEIRNEINQLQRDLQKIKYGKGRLEKARSTGSEIEEGGIQGSNQDTVTRNPVANIRKNEGSPRDGQTPLSRQETTFDLLGSRGAEGKQDGIKPAKQGDGQLDLVGSGERGREQGRGQEIGDSNRENIDRK